VNSQPWINFGSVAVAELCAFFALPAPARNARRITNRGKHIACVPTMVDQLNDK
jgi:hypothetical protein